MSYGHITHDDQQKSISMWLIGPYAESHLEQFDYRICLLQYTQGFSLLLIFLPLA